MDFSFLKEFKSAGTVKLKTHIAAAIRNGIIEGRLTPGQQLQQDKIAAAMGVSSIPVREALSALQEEHYVAHFPNRGTFVSEIDIDKVREVFEIRFFLESGALSIALPKMTEADFDQAGTYMHMEAEATEACHKAEADLAFHMALCRASGRPQLLQMIEQIHNHTARFVNLGIYLMNFKRHPEFNHKALFTVCRERNVARATHILKHHLEFASDLISSRFTG